MPSGLVTLVEKVIGPLNAHAHLSPFSLPLASYQPQLRGFSELGERVRAVRHRRKLSQLDIVRTPEFSLSHYQKIERGALDPRYSTLRKVADAVWRVAGGVDERALTTGVARIRVRPAPPSVRTPIFAPELTWNQRSYDARRHEIERSASRLRQTSK